MLDNVARAAHHHRRDAICLEVASGQTHGLVTNRSGRNQDRRINAVRAAHVEYLWGVAFRRKALAAERGYRVEPAIDLTNSAIGGRFLKSLQRKVGVDVLGPMCASDRSRHARCEGPALARSACCRLR